MNNLGDESVVKRLRWRHLLPLAVLALASILLVQAGSAARPPVTKFEICIQDSSGSPACGGTASSVLPGNSTVALKLSVENDGTSTTSIGSANINVPTQLLVVSGSGAPSSNVTTSGQQIRIRGVKIQPGKSFVATINVNVACGGQFSWPAQQAASGDNLAGTSFAYQPDSSTGVSTSITTACHLAFVTQPTDTTTGAKIADSGASTGGPIKVGLFNGATGTASPMTSCPVGYLTCSVDINRVLPDGTFTNGADALMQPLTGSPFVATFSNLSIAIANTPEQFRLTAATHDTFAPLVNSGSFLIADEVSPVSCTSGQCSLSQKQLKHTGLADSFADLVGVQNFGFMTLSPFTLNTVPQGCTGRLDLGVTGFAESDSRNGGSGSMTIRFYVNHDILQARYGKNVGQQFIEICAGGRPVDTATGVIHECTDPGYDVVGGNTHGWVGDEVKAGKFTGKPIKAVCNADGYYWGILGSYQDKLPTGNPVVTGWGGQNIGGDNYRFFDINVPAGWDWRSGP